MRRLEEHNFGNDDLLQTLATMVARIDLDAGVTFPVHSHDLDGELSILVLEGEGVFLGENDMEMQAREGDILRSQIREPHGVRAATKMRILVTIAPPI